jgi:hypothetical protein
MEAISQGSAYFPFRGNTCFTAQKKRFFNIELGGPKLFWTQAHPFQWPL